MLIRKTTHCAHRRGRGFSLIEMMIAIVIGMIVTGGAITLIVAINQANSETIQSTRLTQELRTLASVITEDVKRTRRIDDPVAMVGQGTAAACPAAPLIPVQPCYPLKTYGVAGCLAYGYTGTIGNQALYNYRYVTLNSNSIQLDQYTFDPATAAKNDALPKPADLITDPCPNATKPTGTTKTSIKLNSNEVKITTLCFSSSTDAGTCYFDTASKTCKLNTIVPVGNEIDVCIGGQMQAGDVYSNNLTRGFVQPIFVRSISPSGS